MNAKTIMMSAVILLAIAGATFGQPVDDPIATPQHDPQTRRQNGGQQAEWKGRRPRDPRVEKSAASGSLAFIKGRIALQSDDAAYYLRGVDRLIGFVDGLTEGAEVGLEGYAFAIPQKDQNAAAEYVFHVVKLTFNEKEYNLSNNARFSQAPRRVRSLRPFGQFERFREFRDFHKRRAVPLGRKNRGRGD
ncbi:MAG: hypothetical protein LBH85_02685 [Treponema sp.]|nr:hypothetical protein [Treponema sp.]